MAASQEGADLKSWAKAQKLAPEITVILEENGFKAVEELSALTPADVKDFFQDSGLLNIAQCVALRKAISSLTQNHYSASAAAPTSTPPQLHQAPSWSSDPSPQPPTSLPHHPHHAAPQPQPYPVQSHPYPLSQPQPYPHTSQSTQGYPQLYPHLPQTYPSAPGQGAAYGGASYPNQTQPSHPYPPAGQSSWGGTAVAGAGMVGHSVPFGMEGSDGTIECFRFLLLGKTGSGKSTTGNTIFGERLFETAATFCSVTSDCERKTNIRGGRRTEIIDSPGLYDTHKTQEEIGVIIVQAVAGMHPGPHAILYVVRLGRYTAEEFGAYQRLKALFDDSISRYLIVVFTYGDMLERDHRSISDMIASEMPPTLQQVLRECNNRYIVFNNVAANPQPQVEQLLQMVRAMMRDNGDQPYSCPKYASIGQGMEEEVAKRLQEVEKRDLQRQKYVQQLEQQTKEAEETARTAKEQYEKNEEERQQQMRTEEERRRQLEEQLQTQIREQQIGFEKYQQELQHLHEQQEVQERMMKEKEAQMSEMERKIAEEQAEKMRQQEQELQAMMERMQCQKQQEEERHLQMEREHVEYLRQMEEERKKDREEMERREEERQRLREQQLEEEREAARRREESYQKEMESLKNQIMENKAADFVTACATAVRGVIEILAEVGRMYSTEDTHPTEQVMRRIMGARDGQRALGGRESPV